MLNATSLQPHGLHSPWNSPGQNTGVGSHSFLLGDLSNPGIEPRSPASQVDSLPAEPPGKPRWSLRLLLNHLVQFGCSVVSDSATPWTTACQTSLSITNSQSLPKLMSIELVMPSNRLILCQPLLLLPSIFPSISVFSSESVLHIRWPKYWSFNFSIRPSNEHSGLISFRMDWLDLLAGQGTLKSILQHKSINSLALSFLYSPTLTSIHDYWKNHSFD